MELLITALQRYEETALDFKDFPEEPTLDPTGDYQNDYAVLFISSKNFHKLVEPNKPNLKIKTYYGEIIVSPDIEEKISDKAGIIPLSPWIYLVTPPVCVSKKSNNQERKDHMKEQIEKWNPNLKNKQKVPNNFNNDEEEDEYPFEEDPNSNTEELNEECQEEDTDLGKPKFDFSIPISFKASIEATNAQVTTYEELLKRFFESELKFQSEEDEESQEKKE